MRPLAVFSYKHWRTPPIPDRQCGAQHTQARRHADAGVTYPFYSFKENDMKSRKSSGSRSSNADQHAKAGAQGGKNTNASSGSKSGSGMRGGSAEQHSKAGKQSHKNS
jgi:hypothetical protein